MSFLARFSSKKSSSRKTTSPSPIAPPPSLTLPLTLPSPSLSNGHDVATPSTSSLRSVSERGGPWVRVSQEDMTNGDSKEREAEREEAEKRKLGRARLGVASASVLMECCAKSIKERGSTTLGIFRPYRLAESPREIRKLAVLFLTYSEASATGSKAASGEALWSAAAISKEEKLEAFKEELKWANVHDVIGLLKWGLRHLRYSTSFSGSTTPALTWYTSYLPSATPPSSFTTTLLPSLPASSQTLLLSTLSLLESISAQAEHNAMGAHRLARLHGAWVFGSLSLDANLPAKEWAAVYDEWRAAGDALEGTLKAFLRAQGVEALPRRLKEVVGGWPEEKSGEGRKVKVLKVEMETKGDWRDAGSNDQETGLLGGDGARRRRHPLVVLAEAFKAQIDGPSGEAKEAWAVVVRRGAEGPIAVLSDETTRILNLVGLATLPSPPPPPTSPNSTSLSAPSTVANHRRRSFSHDPTLSSLSEESTSPTSPVHNFPNRSVGNLFKDSPTSWSDFAASGFGNDVPTELGLLPPRLTSSHSQTVGPSVNRSTALRSSIPREVPVTPKPRPVPVSTIKSIQLVDLDEEFQDVYLETLVDPSCDAWPSFVLSDLHSSLIAELATAGITVDHLLVAEVLRPLSDTPADASVLARSPSARSLAPSIADSTLSRRWNRRVSSLFTSGLTAKARVASGHGASSDYLPSATSSPPSSPRKKKSSTPAPPLPSSPIRANGERKEVSESSTSTGGSTVKQSLARRLSESMTRPSKVPASDEVVPPLPTTTNIVLPDVFDGKVEEPAPVPVEKLPVAPEVPSKEVEEEKKHETPAKDVGEGVEGLGVTAAAAGFLVGEELERKHDGLEAPVVENAVAEPPVVEDAVAETPVDVKDEEEEGGIEEHRKAAEAAAAIAAERAAEIEEDRLAREKRAADEATAKARALAERLAIEKEAERVRIEVEQRLAREKAEAVAAEEERVTKEKAAAEQLRIDEERRLAQQQADAAERARIEQERVVKEEAAKEQLRIDDERRLAQEQAEATERSRIDDERLQKLASEEAAKKKAEEEAAAAALLVAPVVVEERKSSETVRRPAEEALAKEPASVFEVPAQSAPAASPEEPHKDSMDTISAPLPASPVSDTPPATPSKDTAPSFTFGSALSTATSNTSNTSTVAPDSPSGSPTASSSKKFLGSKAIGGLLRRKKSTVEEKLTKAQLKEAKKQEEKELKKRVPQPVSSVKKRVLEIEAEAKGKQIDSAALVGGSPGKSTSGQSSPVAAAPVAVVSPPVQEPKALADLPPLPVEASLETALETKAPAPLEELPSALPTPIPTTETSTPLPAPAELTATEEKEPIPVEGAFPTPAVTEDSLPPIETSVELPVAEKEPSPVSAEDTPATPTPDKTFELPAVPAAEVEPEHFEEPLTASSTPEASEAGGDDTVVHGTGVSPQLFSYPSVTSLAETTTSFTTADSEQSL